MRNLIIEAINYKNRRDYANALNKFDTAFELCPALFNESKIWSALFNAPEWFENTDEHREYFNYAYEILSSLNKFLAEFQEIAQPVTSAFMMGSQFRHTTHNNYSLKELMSLRSEIFQNALAPLKSIMEFSFKNDSSFKSKIKYGILLKHLKSDPETIGAISYFEHAKSNDVEVIIFVTGETDHSSFSKRIEKAADKIIFLPNNLIESVNKIRLENLDFLFFANDVSAKTTTASLLTFFKLARFSFSCVSTIATTAAPYLDGYLSSDFFKKNGFEKEFTEKFIGLPFPGFSFSPHEPTDPQNLRNFRTQLNINASDIILTSGANYTKLHSQLIDAWADMLLKIPNSVLVLYPFPPHFGATRFELEEKWINQFMAKGVDKNSIKILPSLGSREAVIDLLKIADIGLDSFPYSGLTTIVDAMEANLPLITLSGPMLRNNHAAAILDSINLNGLIAKSIDEYILLAKELAMNDEKRLLYKNKIKDAISKSPSFLNPRDYCNSVVNECRKIYREFNQ